MPSPALLFLLEGLAGRLGPMFYLLVTDREHVGKE